MLLAAECRPYLGGVHGISLAHYYVQRQCQLCTGKLVDRMCVDQPRFQTNDRGLWSGNETTYAHTHKILNGILSNGQQPDTPVNSFIDQGGYEDAEQSYGFTL